MPPSSPPGDESVPPRPVQHGDKFTLPGHWLPRLHELLRQHPWPPDDREAVHGKGRRLGLQPTQGMPLFWGRWRELVVTVNRMVAEALSEAGRFALWSSIQVNADSIARPHQDVGVDGISLVFLAGAFSGGAFRCESLLLRDSGFLLAFDPRKPHHSEEFAGERFALILHNLAGRPAPAGSEWGLRALGFPAHPECGRPVAPGRVMGRPFRFLYLFAGPERPDSVAEALLRSLAETPAWCCYDRVEAMELDLCRDPRDDLLTRTSRSGCSA